MKRLWTISTLAATLALSSVAHAVVDMKNSNYADSWLDISLPGASTPLKVQRHYNSRSIFSGIFGFGWCSDFETNIEKLPEGRIKVTECGAGQEVFYSPAKFESKDIASTIETIVAHYKKSNPGASPQMIETLRSQVANDADLRQEWAANAGIATPGMKKGSEFIAENIRVEKISFDGSSYTRQLSDGTLQKFDAAGRLIATYDKNGNYLKLSYAGDKLSEVIDTTGRKLSFTFHPNSRRVKSITAPGSVTTEYEFKGEDLITVKNMWRNTYKYEYDGNHNLTKILFPDNTFKALTYDVKNDLVTSFTDRAIGGKTCLETYKYEMDKENPRDHFWALATKKCGDEIVNDSRFEFWHSRLPDGRKVLSRVLTKSMTDSLDVTYHSEFGRPTVIKRNGVTTSFDYFPNGLIREKATTNVKMVYEYKNQYNKVSKVSADFFDGKGKVIRKRETTFTYDSKANLVGAQNTDGQSVKLTYDVRGRIATIVDQAKKEVLIKYEEKTGKPAQITRPKLGSIALSYKANGEIKEVKSGEDPIVAVQIASTFNNLLDIIAPATSELNL